MFPSVLVVHGAMMPILVRAIGVIALLLLCDGFTVAGTGMRTYLCEDKGFRCSHEDRGTQEYCDDGSEAAMNNQKQRSKATGSAISLIGVEAEA